MDDRNGLRKRIKELHAISVTWRWWCFSDTILIRMLGVNVYWFGKRSHQNSYISRSTGVSIRGGATHYKITLCQTWLIGSLIDILPIITLTYNRFPFTWNLVTFIYRSLLTFWLLFYLSIRCRWLGRKEKKKLRNFSWRNKPLYI